MKILFEFSREDFKSRYESLKTIHDHLLNSGHKLTRDLLKETESSSDKLPSNVFDLVEDAISNADAVIIEGSRISIGTGFVLNEAINKSKPVLFITNKKYNNIKKRFVSAIDSKYLYADYYKSTDELKDKVDEFLSNAKEIRTRFNLVLPNRLDSYVSIKSEKLGISKTEYLIGLIEKDMQSD